MTMEAGTALIDNQEQLADLDLIAAAQRGDRRAFGELVCRHQKGVIGVVYRMCGDPYLAEEAAQEAFLRAWQHLAGYQPRYSFRAWVYRIAINAALDALRRQNSRREQPLTAEGQGNEGETGPEADLPVDDEGPEAAMESKQRAERIRQAVLALPPPSRSVLVLREYGGLAYAEIAASLGIPIGTVMSRLNSARGQLRQSRADLMEVL